MVGGTPPFGLRKPMPVYVEKTILDLEKIYINGGKHGYLAGLSPAVLSDQLHAVPVEVGVGE